VKGLLFWPKSPEGQGVACILSNSEALVRCCDDGAREIDNNGAERSLRGVALGRKNWMFLGSEHGGRTTALLNSLTATRNRLHIHATAYLRDVFERIKCEDCASNNFRLAWAISGAPDIAQELSCVSESTR
jgi:transposase